MPLPQFANLGQDARDIFSKYYHLGLFKLDMKTKSTIGMEISSGVTTELDTLSSYGGLETRYKKEELGFSFVQKYDTRNVLHTAIALVDQVIQGTALSFNCSYAPELGTIKTRITASFANDISAFTADMDVSLANPALTASAVLGCNCMFCGIQMSFDLHNYSITGNCLTLGYLTSDFILQSSLDDGTTFTGSYYQKVDPNLETAVQVMYSFETSETGLGIGCKYNLSSDASVCAKINTDGQLGLGYKQKLHEGITMYLSSQYNTRDFTEGGHKFGAALSFEL